MWANIIAAAAPVVLEHFAGDNEDVGKFAQGFTSALNPSPSPSPSIEPGFPFPGPGASSGAGGSMRMAEAERVESLLREIKDKLDARDTMGTPLQKSMDTGRTPAQLIPSIVNDALRGSTPF